MATKKENAIELKYRQPGISTNAIELETTEEPEAVTLDQAFEVIKEHIAKGHSFSFEQMDIGIEVSLNLVLPDSEKQWFREIAATNRVPLWQALWAQYRRSHENGLANALLLDPGWKQSELVALTPRTCPVCGETFQPQNPGQTFDKNECGVEEERRIREQRLMEGAEQEAGEGIPIG